MTKRLTLIIPAALAILVASGVALARSADRDDDTAGLAKALAGLKPGKPMQCMPIYRDNQLAAYGKTLVYTVTRSLKYVTHTTGSCASVARGDILITRITFTRPCSGDIATTVSPTSRFPTGSCVFGDFTEYRK